MKFKLFILFFITLFSPLNSMRMISVHPGGIIWDRIPKFAVQDRVYSFLTHNQINNCYEHVESDNTLLLKCWKENRLVDVRIDIKPSYRKKKALSVFI